MGSLVAVTAAAYLKPGTAIPAPHVRRPWDPTPEEVEAARPDLRTRVRSILL